MGLCPGVRFGQGPENSSSLKIMLRYNTSPWAWGQRACSTWMRKRIANKTLVRISEVKKPFDIHSYRQYW
jgi:hypothetical protein